MVNRNKNQRILYITHKFSKIKFAADLNTNRRKNVLENVGFTVSVFQYASGFMQAFLEAHRLSQKVEFLYIRIDGTSVLDKFSLLKIINPKLKVIWELHGFPEENLNE